MEDSQKNSVYTIIDNSRKLLNNKPQNRTDCNRNKKKEYTKINTDNRKTI